MKAGFNCEIKECKEKKEKNELDIQYTDITPYIVWCLAGVFTIFLILIARHGI